LSNWQRTDSGLGRDSQPQINVSVSNQLGWGQLDSRLAMLAYLFDKDVITLGRGEEADIRVKSSRFLFFPLTARLQAQIIRKTTDHHERYYIINQGRAGQTQVSGESLVAQERRELFNGLMVKVGKSAFYFLKRSL